MGLIRDQELAAEIAHQQSHQYFREADEGETATEQ